nr:MAG TPA: hypothetical protein [Caudoviricetes sp.]
MSSADRALDAAANYLALHPRITCAALLLMFELAGQLDWYLP